MALHDTVLCLAQTFVGELSQAEAAALDRLCLGAEQQLRARLRPGVSDADCGDSFACAAAWMALAAFGCGQAADGVTSFAASDLKLSRHSGAAVALMAQADAMMAPYLADGFAFLGVGS